MPKRSIASRTAQAQAHETTLGASPLLRIRTDPEPAEPESSRVGTILLEIPLPADWATAAGGVLSGAGVWSGVAIATGTAGHYEIVQAGGSPCHEQGSVSGNDPPTGDIVLGQPSLSIVVGQTVTISGYAVTWG